MLQDYLNQLLALTAKTAVKVLPYHGRGQKETADKICVEHLRAGLNAMTMGCTIVIGEGEKDEAPQLYRGEVLGAATAAVKYDLAIDPLECTSFFANGLGNSLVVLAFTPEHQMQNCGDSFYMDKIALPRQLTTPQIAQLQKEFLSSGAINYDEFLPALAQQLHKKPSELNIYLLDKERHKKLETAIKNHGARMLKSPAGDVAGAVLAMTGFMPYHWQLPTEPCASLYPIDALLGVGGSPEGMISAVMATALAAPFFGRFAPQSAAEQEKLKKQHYDFNHWYDKTQLVRADANDCLTVLTAITDGMLLRGVRGNAKNLMVDSLVITAGQAKIITTKIPVENN